MIARVGTVPSSTGDRERGVKRLKEIVTPTLKKQKGFKTIYLLAGLENHGNDFIISMWDSEADLQNWLGSEDFKKMQERMQEAALATDSPIKWEVCEVSFQS